MRGSDIDGFQTSVKTTESGDQRTQINNEVARRQLLGFTDFAVGVTVSSSDIEADGSESFRITVELRASGVWNDHYLPARNVFISSEGVNAIDAKEELRETLQDSETVAPQAATMIAPARTLKQIPVRQDALPINHRDSRHTPSVLRWEVAGSSVRALLLSRQERQQPVFRSHLYQFSVEQNNE